MLSFGTFRHADHNKQEDKRERFDLLALKWIIQQQSDMTWNMILGKFLHFLFLTHTYRKTSSYIYIVTVHRPLFLRHANFHTSVPFSQQIIIFKQCIFLSHCFNQKRFYIVRDDGLAKWNAIAKENMEKKAKQMHTNDKIKLSIFALNFLWPCYLITAS